MPEPATSRPGSAVAALRAATAVDHQRVDRTFGRFDLTDRDGYARFLTAHALALPGIEDALAGAAALPLLRPRAPLVFADLRALDRPMPSPLPCRTPADDAEAFGMAYVLEGSRLGGALLARSVPADMPCGYLSATHRPGEWRDFLLALEAAAAGDAWIIRATAVASHIFLRYAEAADTV